MATQILLTEAQAGEALGLSRSTLRRLWRDEKLIPLPSGRSSDSAPTMASFRFCRTDDVPLLVEAYNACYHVHFPDLPPMTVDRFKRAAREIDLWASSCMVAVVDSKPAAVLLATKRDTETQRRER